MSLREELEERLQAIPGVVRRVSRYGHGWAYYAGDREIAHFHGDERMDVRLTSARIRELKAEGALDARVRTRGPSAHWAAVSVSESGDVCLAVHLVVEAVRSNAEERRPVARAR